MGKKTLKEELEEYKDKYLRALAELDNYRKRIKKEKEELVNYASERLILELIPVLDNFERGLSSLRDIKSDNLDDFYRGIELIYDRFKELLEKEGIKSFSAVGEKFNPARHEAVSVTDSGDCPPDTVVSELCKGYILKDKVIRPAKVVVAKKRNDEVRMTNNEKRMLGENA
ncbi:MAG: nucleotide exchange factor GrpE [bacterium]|nr:nucleotide exchange factor GrpE [bacterium]